MSHPRGSSQSSITLDRGDIQPSAQLRLAQAQETTRSLQAELKDKDMVIKNKKEKKQIVQVNTEYTNSLKKLYHEQIVGLKAAAKTLTNVVKQKRGCSMEDDSSEDDLNLNTGFSGGVVTPLRKKARTDAQQKSPENIAAGLNSPAPLYIPGTPAPLEPGDFPIREERASMPADVTPLLPSVSHRTSVCIKYYRKRTDMISPATITSSTPDVSHSCRSCP